MRGGKNYLVLVPAPLSQLWSLLRGGLRSGQSCGKYLPKRQIPPLGGSRTLAFHFVWERLLRRLQCLQDHCFNISIVKKRGTNVPLLGWLCPSGMVTVGDTPVIIHSHIWIECWSSLIEESNQRQQKVPGVNILREKLMEKSRHVHLA